MAIPINVLIDWNAQIDASAHEYTILEYLTHKMRVKAAVLGKDHNEVSLYNFRQFYSSRTDEPIIYAERYFQHCKERLISGEWLDSYVIHVARREVNSGYADCQKATILLSAIEGKELISNGSRRWLARSSSAIS